MKFERIDEITWAIWGLVLVALGTIVATIFKTLDSNTAVPVITACVTGVGAMARGSSTNQTTNGDLGR